MERSITFVAGGSFYFAHFRQELIGQFIEKGWIVHLVMPDSDRLQELTNIGARCHVVEFDRRRLSLLDLKAIHEIAFHGRSSQILVGFSMRACFLLLLARLVHPDLDGRTYFFLTGLGHLFTSGSKLVRKLLAAVWRTIDAGSQFIVQNGDDADSILRAGLAPCPASVVVIHSSGVDLEHYAGVSEAFSGSAPIRFGFLGRFLHEKGIVEYMRAVARLKACPTQFDAEFRIWGKPDPSNPSSLSQAEVRAMAKPLGIEVNDWAEDLAKALEDLDVLVLPSHREGFPRTVLEASAAGRFCIVSDAPGCRQSVVNGKTGFVFRTRDVGHLASQMAHVLGLSRADLRGLATEAQRYASLFAVDRVNKRTLRALKVDVSESKSTAIPVKPI